MKKETWIDNFFMNITHKYFWLGLVITPIGEIKILRWLPTWLKDGLSFTSVAIIMILFFPIIAIVSAFQSWPKK